MALALCHGNKKLRPTDILIVIDRNRSLALKRVKVFHLSHVAQHGVRITAEATAQATKPYLIKPTQPLFSEDATVKAWETWKQQWEDFAAVNQLRNQAKGYAAAVFRWCL